MGLDKIGVEEESATVLILMKANINFDKIILLL